MYTIRHDKPVNPVILEILAAVQSVTRELGCDYLLVGATARDMLMTHVFGIALENWGQFQALKAALLANGDFTQAADKVHLLHYKSAEYGNAFPLDLIPFGGVEQEAHQIAWPPDMNVIMNVTAYAEALESAMDVDTGEGGIIRVVSIPSLAALKLLAWDERGLQDNKDAQDLLFLLKHYHEAGNTDRIYDDAYDLLEARGYDPALTGAVLLGQDTGVTLHADSLGALLAILADPRKRDRLLVHMTRSADTGSDTADKLLSQFELGLQAKKIPAA